MKLHRIKHRLSILLIGILILSCMSCGSSSSSLAGGGTGGSGIVSKGVIAAFGSVVVNGTEFDTGNALIVIEGEEIGVGDDMVRNYLDPGKYVTVIGSGGEDAHNALADKVIYNSHLKGPVESVLPLGDRTKEMIVLGQKVVTHPQTKFEEISLDDIAVNDVLEISGIPDDQGAVHASFIEKTGEFTPSVILEVIGYLENLNVAQQIFYINDLTIDYSQADLSGLAPAELTEGLFVEVAGTRQAVGENMQANRVELADDLDISNADQIEVFGFITEVLSAIEFKIGNQTIVIDEDVQFVDGGPEDITPGAKLEAEGMLEDSILYAWEIEFWEPNQLELEGLVTHISSDSEFHMGNQVVLTNENTVFENGTPSDISLGIPLEIKGKIIDGILVADKVSFEFE